MAKDISKILKTIEHFGEGTFDEIEQIIQQEESIVSSLDKEILTNIVEEPTTLDIDIDSILSEDLKALDIGKETKEKTEEKTKEKTSEEKDKKEFKIEDLLEEKPGEEIKFEEGLEIPQEEFKIDEILEEKPEKEVSEQEISFEDLKIKKQPQEGISLEEIELTQPEEKASIEELELKQPLEKEKPEVLTELEKGFELPEEFELSGLEGIERLEQEQKIEVPKGFEETEKIEGLEQGLEEGLEEGFKEGLEGFGEESLEGLVEHPLIKHEEPEIPEEFVDLSLAVSGLPFETEISHEKPSVDYSSIQLSDEDIHIIINTLKNYPVWLSTEIKNLILNDALSLSELEGLLDLLSNNVHWKAVMEYLKNSLNIDLSYHLTPEEKVYIPTLTEKILPYIKWISALTVLAIVIFIIIFQFIIIPNQALNYYQKAINVLEKENNVELAMLNFNRAASMRKYQKYYILFSRLLLERNYFEEAEQIALRGKNVWSKELSFYELLSDIYFTKGGDKNISKAFTILEDLLSDKTFATNPATYEAIAKRYEIMGQYQEAINIYSEGLRHFDATFSYYVKMLKNFVLLRNYEAASDIYSKIDKKFKKLVDPEVFTKYSEFLLEENKPFEAKDVFDKILKFVPNYAPAYLPYAYYYKKMNEPEVALQGLLKAEKYINLGLYKETKDIVFDKILNEIGELYYDKNDDTLAYTYFEKAIAVNPNFGEAYYNIGRLNYYYYNQYQVALKNLLKSQQLGFSNDQQKYMIGWIQYHLKNYEEALFSFLQLELEHFSNIDLKLAIGNSHIKYGKAELAIGYLLNFVSYWENIERQLRGRDVKNPKRQEAMLKLATGYNNLGVACAMLAREKKNPTYEAQALRLFIKSQEIYNYIFPGRVSNAESYINSMYILHPEVKRELLLMDNENYFPKMIF